MSTVLSLVERIHARALEVSSRHKHTEAELIEIIQEAEDHLVFLKRGCSSLYNYMIGDLKLSENLASNLITIARKSREVPILREKVRSGEITLSNARRVCSVLTAANQEEWIEKAATLPTRLLEKEIVKINPREATRERMYYVTPERVALQVGLSEDEMFRLRRVQDLLSQKRKRPVDLEETITALTSEFLERHDPIERAKRNGDKRTLSVLVGKHGTGREPLTAEIQHRVNLRDQGRCTYTLPDGSRCNQARWIQIHHIRPVSQGGENTLENLTTLCSAHHKLQHQ